MSNLSCFKWPKSSVITVFIPNLKELSNKEILEMSKNSLIREIIKKKELNRIQARQKKRKNDN